MSDFSSNYRFGAAFLVLMIAFVLRYKLGAILGWWPDFIFASLVTFAFFLGFLEILFLTALCFLILNWYPGFSLEMALFVILPIVLFFFRKIIFALQGWLSSIFSVFLGLVLFYLIPNASLVINRYDIFLKDIGLSVLFGFLVFFLFDYFYRESVV